MPQIIPTRIAGAFNYPEGKLPLKAMKPGDKFIAMREPDNAYDPNAIALYVPIIGPSISSDMGNGERIETPDIVQRKVKVGYLPKLQAIFLKDRKLTITRGSVDWNSVIVEIE